MYINENVCAKISNVVKFDFFAIFLEKGLESLVLQIFYGIMNAFAIQTTHNT